MTVQRVTSSWQWKALAVLCVLALASQILPVTRLVYNPQQVSIEGSTVTLYRSFPLDRLGLPRPRISYVETVRPLTTGHNGGHTCLSRGGPFQYGSAAEFGEWQIPWAAACLSDPNGYVWEASWTWHLGQFTFGQTTLKIRVLQNGE